MTRVWSSLISIIIITFNASLAWPQSVTAQPAKSRPRAQQGAKAQSGTKAAPAAKSRPAASAQPANTQTAAKAQPAVKEQGAAKDQPAAKAQTQGKDQSQTTDQSQANDQSQTKGQTTATTQPIQIKSVLVFQTAETAEGEASYYMEITGDSFPDKPTLFLAPEQDLSQTKPPEVVTRSSSQIVVKFTAAKGYFPATVGLVGSDGTIKTYDVPKGENPFSDEPKITDIEVLQLDRNLGTGRIKIDGANFGSDKDKISVEIVPYDPSLPAFGPVPPADKDKAGNKLVDPNGQPYYICPGTNTEQQTKAPQILTAQDDIVVVEFSFACQAGYSKPFRIARVLLTVTKGTVPDKTSPEKSTAGKQPQSMTASFEAVPGRDKNLRYRSTILSEAQASSRFGGGVAKNFYVVQLSIVNKGKDKVQIPLAGIQAEVEWYVGTVKSKNQSIYYREGPPTVAPVPLAGAVSYFSAYQKATGPRARFFNTLQGVTTIGSAVQLFFGPGFAQAVGIAGGGLRQGLGQIWQDMSSEQLANLTAQSFESLESISANGGSLEKVIFIQKTPEKLASIPGTAFGRLIDNVIGFEINGYKAPETPEENATPEQQ